MRVLVTGGAGFIGRRVTEQLVLRGHDVAVVTRRDTCDIGKAHVIRGDLSEIDKIEHLLREWKADSCIHLAWYAEPGKYLSSPLNVQFLGWSLDLLRALASAGCRHVVMAGTCAEYDSDYGYLREDSPTRPSTLYAASKLSLYLTGRQLAELSGIRFTWGRVFFPYGPGEDPRRAVSALINALLRNERFKATEGAQVRDYLHVDDIASAFVTLMESEAEGCFNIASGNPVTVRSLMETIGDITGRRGLIDFGAIPYREWDPMFICGDNHRLHRLGWKPDYSLKTGLEAAVNWWRQQLRLS